jgi:hypothetical protein
MDNQSIPDQVVNMQKAPYQSPSELVVRKLLGTEDLWSQQLSPGVICTPSTLDEVEASEECVKHICPICQCEMNIKSSGKRASVPSSLLTTNSEGDRSSPEESTKLYVTTHCNHTFCKSCLQNVFTNSPEKFGNTDDAYTSFSASGSNCTISCPICRNDIHHNIFYVDLSSLVGDPDLSFIKNDSMRNMILNAYNTIHKHELWGELRELTPNEHEGFMFSNDPKIMEIMNLINNEDGNHSGASLAITMRTIQQISRYGVDSLNT